MNFRVTIVLLVVFIALGALWFFLPGEASKSASPVEEKPNAALKVQYVLADRPKTEDVVKVTVDRPDQPQLAFEKEPAAAGATPGSEQWTMTAPLATKVETYQVTNLVRAFADLESRTGFEPGAPGQPSVAEAGLEPPTATVTLVDKGGKAYALEVGKQVLMSTDTYVRAKGAKTIHISKRDLLPLVKKELKDYRAKRLVDLKVDEAVRLDVDYDGKSYDLTRGGDQQWVINTPVRGSAEREKVRTLLTKFNALRVEDFTADKPESLVPYGLDKPYLTVKVTTEKRVAKPAPPADPNTTTQPAEPQFETVTGEQTVLIGAPADLKGEQRYVKLADAPWVATITDTNVQGLVPNLKELRDPRVVRVRAADATRLEMSAGGQTAELNKVGQQWQGTGAVTNVDPSAVQEVLAALEDLRAIDYVDEPGDLVQYGLAQPRATYTLTAVGQLAPVTVKIGDNTASGRNAYVQCGDSSTVIVTAAVQADRLAISLLTLRSRDIFNFPTEQITRVVAQRPHMTYEMVRGTANEWTLLQPANAPADASNTRVLVNDLSHLRAKAVVAEGAVEEYGLDNPLTSLTFTVTPPAPPAPTTQASQPADTPPAEPPVEHTLRIVRRGGVAYAARDGSDEIYELDDTVYRSLTAELIDPRLFVFKADDITRLKIVATGGTVEFVKEDGQWKYATDPYVELSQKNVKELMERVAGLQAEVYFAFAGRNTMPPELANPPASVAITLSDGQAVLVNMTQEAPGELPRKAALVGQGRIVRLRESDVQMLMRGLDAYVKEAEKPEEPQTPPQMPPGMEMP